MGALDEQASQVVVAVLRDAQLWVARPTLSLPRSVVARVLLGFVFAAAGLVSLLKLGKMGGVPGDTITFLTLMVAHNYTTFVALIMLMGGLLLLVGRFVPLGLMFLGPILVYILLFHFLFHVPGSPTGLVCTVLEVFLI